MRKPFFQFLHLVVEGILQSLVFAHCPDGLAKAVCITSIQILTGLNGVYYKASFEQHCADAIGVKQTTDIFSRYPFCCFREIFLERNVEVTPPQKHLCV